MNFRRVDGAAFTRWLGWLGWLVLLCGWAAAVIVFFVVGDESCATVEVPLAPIKVCQDSTAEASILLAIVGFSATVSALFLWTFRYLLRLLQQIEANTRPGGPKDR